MRDYRKIIIAHPSARRIAYHEQERRDLIAAISSVRRRSRYARR